MPSYNYGMKGGFKNNLFNLEEEAKSMEHAGAGYGIDFGGRGVGNVSSANRQGVFHQIKENASLPPANPSCPPIRPMPDPQE